MAQSRRRFTPKSPQLPFDARCYQALRDIPRGKVTTYQEIARALGSKAYRAVGNAMNRNPDAPFVPCHRVVRADGTIGGYAFGSKKKIALLTREGVSVKGSKISDLSAHFHRFSKHY